MEKNNFIATLTVEKASLLLEFLTENQPKTTPKKLKSFLTHGQITVDGIVKTKYDTPLQKGQTVRISRFGMAKIEENKLLDIIYEDEDIVVINKPSGLLTMSSDSENIRTAYRLLNEYIRRNNPENRIYIVHRLDKDTSGVVLFAKNEKIKTAFQDNWDELVSYRGYIAVVEGRPKDDSGRLVSWLKETSIHTVYSSDHEGDGKQAITNYRLRQTNGKYSMLDVWLETGRKNQIRVQLADIGCPIVGDKRYGAKTTSPICRVGLHANRLTIKHPFTGKVMKFEAPAGRKFMTAIKAGGK